MTVTGTITSIRDFGAFVDIDGLEGLIPVSEISWGMVEDIHERVYEGQQVEVVAMKLDWDKDRFAFSLKQALRVFLEHRQVVVRRRTEHDLEKARDRAHILEGLRIALDNIDEVIRIIRGSEDPAAARASLMDQLELSERQGAIAYNNVCSAQMRLGAFDQAASACRWSGRG